MKIKQSDISKSDITLLTAIVLGDGSLRKPHPKSKVVQLEISHSEKQIEYCIWKRDLVFKLLGGFNPPKISYRELKLNGNNTIYKTCRFFKTHPILSVIRNSMYINNRKSILSNTLENFGPLELAIWYMDDGSFYKKLNLDGTKHICFDLRISTDCFSEEEHDIMVNYFKIKWNINFYKYYSKTRNIWVLRANKEAAIKFINIIKDFVIPSMKYKIEYI